MILGGLGLVQQVVMLVFVYPKLKYLYQDFGAELPWMTRNFPQVTMVMIAILAVITYLGVKLAFGKTHTEGWFVVGLVALFAVLAILGSFVGLSVVSIVGPIYNLTSNI